MKILLPTVSSILYDNGLDLMYKNLFVLSLMGQISL